MKVYKNKFHRCGGFSLIEMLVVIALIALMAGLATQLLRAPSTKLKLDQSVRSLCTAMRVNRSRAIATNNETSIIFDFKRNVYVSSVTGEVALPKDVSVDLNAASLRDSNVRDGAIVFFPDGGSTGIDVVLKTAQAKAEISVNWLTGSVSCRID